MFYAHSRPGLPESNWICLMCILGELHSEHERSFPLLLNGRTLPGYGTTPESTRPTFSDICANAAKPLMNCATPR